MKVKVKWLHSPRQKYGIPRAPGSVSFVEREVAEGILKEHPDFLVILETPKEKPPVVKDTVVKKTRTRPVKREKDS